MVIELSESTWICLSWKESMAVKSNQEWFNWVHKIILVNRWNEIWHLKGNRTNRLCQIWPDLLRPAWRRHKLPSSQKFYLDDIRHHHPVDSWQKQNCIFPLLLPARSCEAADTHMGAHLCQPWCHGVTQCCYTAETRSDMMMSLAVCTLSSPTLRVKERRGLELRIEERPA